MIYLNDNDYRDFLEKQELVVADYFAEWCPPCQKLGPIYEEVAAEMTTNSALKLVKINIDESPQAADAAGVMSIPTLIFYRRGEEVDRLIGGTDKGGLKSFIENNLSAE